MSNLDQNSCIPWMAEKMFYLILPKALRDHVLGDLQEEFYEQVFPQYGLARARWWYRGQVLRSVRFYILKRKGDIMFFLFSIFVFVALSLLAGFLGSTVIYLINIPSLIMVIIPSFVFALASTSVRSWRLCLKLLFIDQDYSEKKEVREASRFLSVFGNMSVAMSLFYMIMGAIQMLHAFTISNSTENNIYASSAVCMLTLFYGIGLKSVLYVADQRLQNKFLS